ncbi:hypothetical protein HF086_013368 [Spodoptera exigua]|uniref:eRF1/Pelota-like N-terminal domain-containing protein n=1 Tax=Spodoptera exigua TaxID=7107 RepID=A0A922MKT6_SPOEX|nr:hypothetical protein HF086_013368 [Spodoptera exigua]
MKLVYKNIERDGCGSIGLVPEESEDMWHAYNLVAVGDAVTASTVRKVQTESSTGSSTSNRVRTTLTITVETIDFDTQALALERVEMACDPAANADVAAVVMQEGLAHVCLITPSMTLVRSKIDITIPRKRKGFVQQHEKGLNKFYDAVMQAILRHVDFNIVKCVIIASPGFVKDQFFEYMMQQAVKTDNKLLIDNKSRFLLVKASSGFKHSLKEVLQEPAVMAKISDTKAASEVKLLENFYTMLQLEPAKAFYGKKHIERANEALAIETLMISDKLFRCQDIQQRREYVALVDSVRENGELDQLTGIAAVLRFPMPELEDSDAEGDSDSD